MNAQNAKAIAIRGQMIRVADQLTISDLKQHIVQMHADNAADDHVLEAMLTALENKMVDADFIAFCESLG